MDVLDEYRKAFDALTTSKNYVIGKKGQGIRKYKQLKRYAYKIGNGQHKSLIINVARFMNEMVNEAHKGRQIVYEDRTDKRLIDLLTKRFNPKKKYSIKAVQIFNNLNMLSEMPKHRSSGKLNLIGGIYYTTPEDLMKRLTLLTGARRACNNNFQLRYEVWKITDELSELSVISKAHDAY